MKVLVLDKFPIAIPELDHGFGTRLWKPDPLTMATMHQVHSNSVLAVDRPGPAGEGDALITCMRGLILSIKTADCYPILIADPRTRSIAAIHAGWRGTAGRIVAETVARMQADFGASPGDLHAAIGPGIGICCYEVGEEVARHFQSESERSGPAPLAHARGSAAPDGTGTVSERSKSGIMRSGSPVRRNIDLAAINRHQLVESGVPAGQIHLAGRCTFCEPDLFHSYRRDGDQAGRMISFISIKT